MNNTINMNGAVKSITGTITAHAKLVDTTWYLLTDIDGVDWAIPAYERADGSLWQTHTGAVMRPLNPELYAAIAKLVAYCANPYDLGW